jgi:chemotaxis protein CheC
LIDVRNLTSLQVDALKEVGNIGAGHAATSLSQLVGKEIMIKAPRLNILPLKEVQRVIKDPQALMVGIYLSLEGNLSGSVLLLFPYDDALSLVDMLMGRNVGSTKALSPLDESALKEVGSILTCSYLNAIAQLIGAPLIPSVPGLAFDMAEAMIDLILIELGEAVDYVLVIETEFTEASRKITGEFMLFPNPGSLQAVLETLGVSNL